MKVGQFVFWNSPAGYSLKDEKVQVIKLEGSVACIRSKADAGESGEAFDYWVMQAELTETKRMIACAVDKRGENLVFEETQIAECRPGARVMRFDGVTGTIVEMWPDSVSIKWDSKLGLRKYENPRFGAIA